MLWPLELPTTLRPCLNLCPRQRCESTILSLNLKSNSRRSLPQKRKAPPSNGIESSTIHAPQQPEVDTSAALDPQLHKDEYEAGKVICEQCGEGISFRDEATGGFTVKHWDEHRLRWYVIT